MIIQKKFLRKTLFIDIETVSEKQGFEDLNEIMQELWMRKCMKFQTDRSQKITVEEAAQWYTDKAGIFAEFAKVVCVTVGYLSMNKGDEPQLRLKSFTGDEVDILNSFTDMMDHHYDRPDEHFLCGHNIKEFDVPFLCRRCVINGVDLPRLMNVAGKKPWQVAHLLDTMELWKFGDYKNYTSLALLAGTLGIPTPKDDIDGSMVGQVYWENEDIERIATYCEKDVITVVQIAMKFSGFSMIGSEQITIADKE